jgi:hypothetical protein
VPVRRKSSVQIFWSLEDSPRQDRLHESGGFGVGIEPIDGGEGAGAQGEDRGHGARSAAARENFRGASASHASGPVDFLAGEVARVIERAGIVVVVRRADARFDFDALSVVELLGKVAIAQGRA